MIDFPNAPTVGDSFVAAGTTYKCTQVSPNVWLDTPASGLGIPDAPNDGKQYGRQSKAWTPVAASGLLQDGTVAAPGLAWANEPTLGWYRPGTSVISMAAQGLQTFTFVASNPTSTILSTNPRAANGSSGFTLINQPYGAANFNVANITCTPAGYLQLTTGAVGSAGLMPIQLSGLNVEIAAPSTSQEASLYLRKSGNVSAGVYGAMGGSARWLLSLASGAAESGSNAGSDLIIQRYSDAGVFLGAPLSINRASGTVNLGAGGLVAFPGGQLLFPSPQIPSTDPHTLDDYAEGNWTPTNGGGVGMTINNATYTKIGRLVHVMAQIVFAANSNASGITIGGLPFNGAGAISVGYPGANLANGLYAFVQGNGINIYAGNAFATFAQLSGASLYVGGTYMAS